MEEHGQKCLVFAVTKIKFSLAPATITRNDHPFHKL